jgi:hypothetical protein
MTDLDYKTLIQSFNWTTLKQFLKKILDKEETTFTSGKALEYLIIRAFELSGAEVDYPYSVRKEGQEIEQIDGLVNAENLYCLIECKNEYEKTNVEPLAKMRSQLLRRPNSVIGSVFSVSGFTKPAIILASYMAPQTILLWERTEIEFVIENECILQSLQLKYKMYVKECIADFNTKKL